jgi:phage terminase large subunit-like protein
MPRDLDPLSVMASLVLEDGSRWGERAEPAQWADARAVLDADGPRRHFLLRSRGRSKTTDTAAMTLAAMVTQIPAGSECYAAAADRDQAGLLVRKMAGLVARTPELAGVVEVGTWRVAVLSRGLVLDVLTADAASSWGLTPTWLVVDEICQWSGSAGARSFFEALSTSLPKVPGSRAVLMSTPSFPSHWSHKVYASALADPLWRVSHVTGPAPWQDPVELEAERRRLPESSFRRLFEGEWAVGEDRLSTVDDIAACAILDGPTDPPAVPDQRAFRRVITLDIGLVNDRTVAVVAHVETIDGRPVLVVDRLRRWNGTRAAPTDLADVETWLRQAAKDYGARRLVVDPYQAVGLAQRLRREGMRVDEFAFTAQSVGRLGAGLHVALRERRLLLPNDDDLIDELSKVRLRESASGYRLDHDSGEHDDQAVAIALAVETLLKQAASGPGAGVVVPYALYDEEPSRIASVAGGWPL